MGKRIGRKRLYSLDKLGQSETTLEPGAAMSGAFGHGKASRHGSEIITELYVDLGAGQVYSPKSHLTGTIIAHSGVLDSSPVQTAPAYLARITNDKAGMVNLIEMNCIEAPVGGEPDIVLLAATSSALVYSGSGGLATRADLFTVVDFEGDAVDGSSAAGLLDGNQLQTFQYLYLGTGANTIAEGENIYTAGKFVIRLFGTAVLDDVTND